MLVFTGKNLFRTFFLSYEKKENRLCSENETIDILIKFVKLLKNNNINGILIFNEQNHMDILTKKLIVENKIH